MRSIAYLFPLILLACAKNNSTDLDKLVQRITAENGPLWHRIQSLYMQKALAATALSTNPAGTTTPAPATIASSSSTTTVATTTTPEDFRVHQERLNQAVLADAKIQALIADWIANGLTDISFYQLNGVCYFHNANNWEQILHTVSCNL